MYRKAFVPNPATRFSAEKVREIAGEMVYVCDTPIFDDVMGDGYKNRFEDRVKVSMQDFDYQQDVLVFFGDILILSMMMISAALDDEVKYIDIARYSKYSDSYITKRVNVDDL